MKKSKTVFYETNDGQPKKMEFFQKVVLIAFIASITIVCLTILGNFILVWTYRKPLTEETVVTITTFGGLMSTITVSAYGILQAIRNWSLNAYCKGQLPKADETENNIDGSVG